MQPPYEAELLRIFIGEADKHDGRPLYEVIVIARPIRASRAIGYPARMRDVVADPWHTMPAMDHGGVVGYLCGLRDPDGNVVAFFHGQAVGLE